MVWKLVGLVKDHAARGIQDQHRRHSDEEKHGRDAEQDEPAEEAQHPHAVSPRAPRSTTRPAAQNAKPSAGTSPTRQRRPGSSTAFAGSAAR